MEEEILLQYLEEVVEEENDDNSDDAEEEIETKADGSYVIEVEDFEPVYDKFVNGINPNASLILDTKGTDYDELFSYLGKRITSDMYENASFSDVQIANKETTSAVFPVQLKTIETGIKKVKYFTPGDVVADSPVPYEGMTSEEYEKFKLWKVLNPAMVKFYMDFL